jgi:hypothetical protein
MAGRVWRTRVVAAAASCMAIIALAGGTTLAAATHGATQSTTLLPGGRGRVGQPRVVNLLRVAGIRPSPGAHPARTLPFLPAPGGPRVRSSSESVRGAALAPAAGAAGPLSPQTATSATNGPEVLTSFPAASRTTDIATIGSDQATEPPDTQVAAGASDLVEPVNNALWVWSKTGAVLLSSDLNVFFPVPSGYSITDPRVTYDSATSRWFLSGLSFDSFNDSQVYLAVSASADPTGNWYVYTISSETGVLQDQPKIGFDSSVVVLSWNDYSGSPMTFSGQETYVLNESQLLTGSYVDWYHFFPDPSRFDVVPAISLTSSTTAYAAYNNSCGTATSGSCLTGSSAIGVVALTGVPPSTVTWTEYDPPMAPTSNPPLADQPGAASSIATDDDRFLSVAYDGGTLYVSGNTSCVPSGDTVARPCARVVEVALGSSPIVTLDVNLAYAGGDVYYPAVVPDSGGNLFVAATFSSTSIYPEATGLTVAAGASSFSGVVLQSGGGVYYSSVGCSGQTFSGCRWGDYSGVAVDPTDPTDVWLAAEYAPSSSNDWGTAIGELTLAPPTVTGVSPTTGPMSGGTNVTVYGSNFAPGAVVDFGTSAAGSVTVVSPTELTAASPAAAAGTVNLTVTTSTGTSAVTTADQFTYIPPPSVTAVSPDYGGTGGGTSVTITGSNFSGATGVLFGTARATSFTVVSPTSISATSPAGSSGTVAVTVSTPYGTSATTSADEFTYVMSAYTALPPTRLLDTRTNRTTLGTNSSLNLKVVGGAVPSDATAVALNVTVTDTTNASYLSVYPAGEPQPLISNLNWSPGETVPNLVIVPVGSGGAVTFYNDQGRADVVVDLEGYFAPEPPTSTVGSYVALTPARIADTRLNSGEPYSGDTLGPGATLDIQVTGMGGVPSSGVAAVLMNVTVTDTTAASYLTVYPQGQSQPLASNLNWVAGDTVANRVVVPVGPTGQIAVFNQFGRADVVVDVDGYFISGGTAPANAGLFTPINPVRVLDTRVMGQPLGPGGSLTLDLAGVDGIGAQATAVVANFTVTDTTAPSYLTVYPGPTRPLASDINWLPGETVPNLTVATLSTSGTTSAYNDQGTTDLVVDAFGYFSP